MAVLPLAALEIVNSALSMNGLSMLSSLENTHVNDNTSDSQNQILTRCLLYYEVSRRELLALFPWNFACNLIVPAKEDPVQDQNVFYGKKYRYKCPVDFLYINRIFNSNWKDVLQYSEYKGGYFYTDESDIRMEYIQDFTVVEDMPRYFISCLIDSIAVKLCSGNASERQLLMGSLQSNLAIAQRAESIQTPTTYNLAVPRYY